MQGTEGEKRGEFDAEVVASVYRDDLGSGNFDVSRVMLLEFSCFLENYLWPNFDEATSSYEHVMCIVLVRAARACAAQLGELMHRMLRRHRC